MLTKPPVGPLAASWLIAAACGLLATGCAPVKTSVIEQRVLEPPTSAFMKKVKNDPFPSAAEQGISSRR